MTRPLDLRRTIALTAVPVLALWSATAAPALADSGNGKSGGQGGAHSASSSHGKSHSQSQDKSKGHGHQAAGSGKSHAASGGPTSHAASGGSHGHSSGSHGNSDAHAGTAAPSASGTHGNSANAPGHSGTKGSKGGKGGGGGHAVTPGNNGTVKIAPVGADDSIPNNTPHVGCQFLIEWYGYDQGSDIISTVTFAAQAPTSDAGITVDGPSSVDVGGDPATGAGTPTGLDGRELYTLSFTGTPHPKQGFHVKLTVATPHSLGNDTKTKVFWVQPCESSTGGETPGGSGGGNGGGGTGGGGDNGTGSTTASTGPGDTEVLGEQASAAPNDTEVLGEQASAAPGAGPAQGRDTLPTAVDAGENGHSAIGDFVRSPWPLAIVALGALLTLVAFASRRRVGARSDSQE